MTSPESNKEMWWHKKADALYFVDEYNDQDKFREGIDRLLIDQHRLSVQACMEVVEKLRRLDELSQAPEKMRNGNVYKELKSRFSALSEMKEKPRV